MRKPVIILDEYTIRREIDANMRVFTVYKGKETLYRFLFLEEAIASLMSHFMRHRKAVFNGDDDRDVRITVAIR